MTITIGAPSITQDVTLRAYGVTVNSTPIDCDGTDIFFGQSLTSYEITAPTWLSATRIPAGVHPDDQVQILIAADQLTESDVGKYTISYQTSLELYSGSTSQTQSFNVYVQSATPAVTSYTYCAEPEPDEFQEVTPNLDYCAIAMSEGHECPPTSSDVVCLSLTQELIDGTKTSDILV